MQTIECGLHARCVNLQKLYPLMIKTVYCHSEKFLMNRSVCTTLFTIIIVCQQYEMDVAITVYQYITVFYCGSCTLGKYHVISFLTVRLELVLDCITLLKTKREKRSKIAKYQLRVYNTLR